MQTETDLERMALEIEELKKNPYLEEFFNMVVVENMEIMVSAAPEDDETRRVYAAEIRAIRTVRDKLHSYGDTPGTTNRV